MKDKKRIIFNMIFIFSLFYSYSLEDIDKVRKYNYYERTYYGNFLIKNIPLTNIKGYKLLEYDGVYKDGKLIQIRGYYYTKQLKFIDEILNDRIIKTDYYYIDGSVIFSKKYFYESNKIRKIEQTSYDNNLNFINIDENFNYDNDFIYLKSKINIYDNKKKGDNGIIIQSTGKYKKDFSPVFFERIINRLGRESIINEYFEYDSNNNLIKYKSILDKNDIIILKNYKYNEKRELMNEKINDYISNNNFDIFYTDKTIKKYLIDEKSSNLKIIQDEKINKYYNNLELKEWEYNLIKDKKNYTKICKEIIFNDEIIFIAKENNVIVEFNIKLNLENYITNGLIFLPRNFYKIYFSISNGHNYFYNDLN